MELRLKTGSKPNPEWAIHWTLTGQTHLYGWVDIEGLHCRVTLSRRKQGGRVEVGLGTDPVVGTYSVEGGTMQLPSRLHPYIGEHIAVGSYMTDGTLDISEIPFVNMAEQSAWEEYYVDLAAGKKVDEPDAPKRDFFHHQVLAADFDQSDTDAIFAGFGFRSHAELEEDS